MKSIILLAILVMTSFNISSAKASRLVRYDLNYSVKQDTLHIVFQFANEKTSQTIFWRSLKSKRNIYKKSELLTTYLDSVSTINKTQDLKMSLRDLTNPLFATGIIYSFFYLRDRYGVILDESLIQDQETKSIQEILKECKEELESLSEKDLESLYMLQSNDTRFRDQLLIHTGYKVSCTSKIYYFIKTKNKTLFEAIELLHSDK